MGPGRTIEESEWRLRKAANLVKLLAFAEGHRLHGERVMNLLWPELGERAAANNLRHALHVARRILEPARETTAAFRYLSFRGELLELCPNASLWVDVEVFEEAAAAARRIREPGAYRVALDLYAGELLPGDLYEEWAEGRREELGRTYLNLLLELATLYEEREEFGAAIEALGRAVAEEPTHEETHAGLMRLYTLAGRRREALG